MLQNITNDFTFVPYQIKLVKMAEGTQTRLEGAVFDLYGKNDQLLGRYTTNENGEISLTGLDESGQYYFKEVKAPAGYELDAGNNNTPFFSPGDGDLVVYNRVKLTTLRVEKAISSSDLAGSPYTVTAADKARPFAFHLELGADPAARYPYVILGADGAPIADYTYTENENENENAIAVAGQGEVGQAGTVYLRHGETLEVRGLPALTPYRVWEENYLTQQLEPQLAEGEYGCADPQHPVHAQKIGTLSGWAASGNNTVGNLPENGALVTFENKRVPQEYAVTISSLAVVERILANQQDIDPQKGFSVTAVIGSDPNQSFYYEVVHTNPTSQQLPGYDADFDYYNRNDPGLPASVGGQAAAAAANGAAVQQAALVAPAPRGEARAGGAPLHRPADAERWPERDGSLQPLSLSAGNTITVELHHESALIVYGIPVGSPYSVRQADYSNVDGYIIDSTVKTEGTILPDLEVLPDHDTGDSRLLRVRADLFNYFVRPVTKTIEIQKNWEHGANPPAQRPIETTVRVIDVNTGVSYDSRSLTAAEDWAAGVEVPKYDPVTGLPIDYGVTEDLPPDYVVSGIAGTKNGFAITNTYAPGAVKPGVQKVVEGEGAPEEKFHFVLRAVTPGAPLPPGGAELSLVGQGVGFFGEIKFERAGVYEYEVAEVPGTAPGYTYDNTVYTLTVTVTESGGALHAAPRYTTRGAAGNTLTAASPLLFRNRYQAAELASLTVKKLVSGPTANPNRLFSFTVELGGVRRTLALKHGESYTFENVPVGTPYTIVEGDYTADGYVTRAEGSTGTVPSGGAAAVFTNTKAPLEGRANLVVTKQVSGPGAQEEKQFRFEVTLGTEKQVIYLKHGESYIFENLPVGAFYSVVENNYVNEGYLTASKGATGTIPQEGAVAAFTNTRRDLPAQVGGLSITKTVNDPQKDPTQKFDFTVELGGVTYRLRLADGETYRFSGIPAGTAYQVTEADASQQGYATSAVGSTGTILPGENACAFVNAKMGEQGGAGRLTITKQVRGAFVDTTRRFRFTVVIGGVEQTVYLRHGEAKTFESLPAGTSYAVAEEDCAAEGYVTASTGATGTITAQGATAAFVNEYTGEAPPQPGEDAVQISGSKTWEHGANPEENRPAEITVYAMNGGVIAAQKTVSAKENWSYAFNLPKYDGEGREITYSINEQAVPDYVKSVSGYDLTNTYAKGGSPQTGDPSTLWFWIALLAAGAGGLWHTLFRWGEKPFRPGGKKKT